MPRMFDLLREEDKKPKAKKKSRISTSEKLIDTVKKKDIDDIKIAKKKYNQTLKFVEVLLEKVNPVRDELAHQDLAGGSPNGVNKEEPLDLYKDEIYKTVDALTNQLILGDSLLEIVAQENIPNNNYLPRHITNVCILSLAVGLQMNFNKSRLHTLGIAAILKDIGMLNVEEIIKQPRALSEDEYNKIKIHPSRSAEIVSKIPARPPSSGAGGGDAYSTIQEIIEQHHERVNGEGYPLGLKADEINDYAKIVGLVDTYEAMTHHRPFRREKMPHEVIREIIYSLKPFFEPDIIKALVDKISIYPIGSFVKLNKGDIAKVVSSNSNSPLRPIVLVLLDSYGNHIPEPKTLDLSKDDSIYIKEPVLLKEDKN